MIRGPDNGMLCFNMDLQDTNSCLLVDKPFHFEPMRLKHSEIFDAVRTRVPVCLRGPLTSCVQDHQRRWAHIVVSKTGLEESPDVPLSGEFSCVSVGPLAWRCIAQIFNSHLLPSRAFEAPDPYVLLLLSVSIALHIFERFRLIGSNCKGLSSSKNEPVA